MALHSAQSLVLGLSLTFLFTTPIHAFKPYIERQVEYNTECKSCPRSLCPNKVAYGDNYGETRFNATCWTRGTRIMGDELWLKSEAGCYVTQYDVFEYEGDYTEDLPYCGWASEIQDLTLEDATLQYKGECKICPFASCGLIAYLREETDVTLTCWTNEDTWEILDDPLWYKSTANCYIHATSLYSRPDTVNLDNCGPVPLLEQEKHWNNNGTSDVNKRAASPAPIPIASPDPDPVPGALAPNYLINVTVGEDWAYCRSCPNPKCKWVERYPFNASVILQCLVDPSEATNNTYWALSTDWCYVRNEDFWESMTGDYYRFPLCSQFDEGGGQSRDEGDGDVGGEAA